MTANELNDLGESLDWDAKLLLNKVGTDPKVLNKLAEMAICSFQFDCVIALIDAGADLENLSELTLAFCAMDAYERIAEAKLRAFKRIAAANPTEWHRRRNEQQKALASIGLKASEIEAVLVDLGLGNNVW